MRIEIIITIIVTAVRIEIIITLIVTAVRMEIIITIIVTAMIMEDGKLEISAPDKEWLPSI